MIHLLVFSALATLSIAEPDLTGLSVLAGVGWIAFYWLTRCLTGLLVAVGDLLRGNID